MKRVYHFNKSGELVSIIRCSDADYESFYTGDGYTTISPNVSAGDEELLIFDGLSWSVKSIAMTDDEVDSLKFERACVAMRAKRNRLIADTDWRFSSDLVPSDEWIKYRQDLRNVPQQSGFPNEIEWPITPNQGK